MTITLSHSAAEGTLARGDTYPHRSVFRWHGWRWSRQLGAWYVPHSRDRIPREALIEGTRRGLEAAGATVAVTIDTERRSTEEQEEDRADRLRTRQAALAGKAERRDTEAEALRQRAGSYVEHIPLGQPILVGHHSERRHRRDVARFGRTMDRAHEAYQEARSAEARAEASVRHQRDRESGPVTVRRIERLETELRDVERRLTSAAMMGKPDPAYAAQLEARRAALIEEVAYWRAHLEEIGHRGFGPADFRKGDRIRLSYGLATVERVSPKSLTVRSDVMPQIAGRVGYSKVLERVAEPPSEEGD